MQAQLQSDSAGPGLSSRVCKHHVSQRLNYFSFLFGSRSRDTVGETGVHIRQVRFCLKHVFVDGSTVDSSSAKSLVFVRGKYGMSHIQIDPIIGENMAEIMVLAGLSCTWVS